MGTPEHGTPFNVSRIDSQRLELLDVRDWQAAALEESEIPNKVRAILRDSEELLVEELAEQSLDGQKPEPMPGVDDVDMSVALLPPSAGFNGAELGAGYAVKATSYTWDPNGEVAEHHRYVLVAEASSDGLTPIEANGFNYEEAVVMHILITLLQSRERSYLPDLSDDLTAIQAA